MASAAALGQTSRLLVGAPQRQQTARGRRPLQVAAAGSTFGHNFRVTTFGESHGGGVGCVIDGVPPRLHITKVRLRAAAAAEGAQLVLLLLSRRAAVWGMQAEIVALEFV